MPHGQSREAPTYYATRPGLAFSCEQFYTQIPDNAVKKPVLADHNSAKFPAPALDRKGYTFKDLGKDQGTGPNNIKPSRMDNAEAAPLSAVHMEDCAVRFIYPADIQQRTVYGIAVICAEPQGD